MKQKLAFKAKKLTKKQKVFVAEYLKDSNGTRAAIQAGFSPKTAREIAYQLLHKTSHVMEAIYMAREIPVLQFIPVYSRLLKGMDKESLKAAHATKTVFPGSAIV